jgi:hypothetical protein
MATKAQLKAAIKALPEPQKSVAQAIYDQAASTGDGLSANEITYISNNLGAITGTTNPNTFLGTAAQRVDANKNGGVVPGFATATATATAAAGTDWSAQYGVQAALIQSDEGLKALFNRAVAENWTPDKFQAEFINTPWYRNNSDTWRTAETTRLTDPASWTEQLNAASELIRQTAVNMGFELDETQVANLASQSLYLAGGSANSIDPKILKTHVAETGRITGAGGTSLATMDALKKYAYDNGISYNDSWYTTAATNILTGDGTVEEWNKQIKDAAISRYAALAPQLNAGMTVMDVASPYIQQMATTFELGADQISLEDPLMQKALTNIGQNNEPTLKPLWQFERELKQDDRYFKTNSAVQDMTGLASEIARQFGKM